MQPKARAIFLLLSLGLFVFFGCYSSSEFFTGSGKLIDHKILNPGHHSLAMYSVSSTTKFASSKKSRVALIIDDAGQNLELLQEIAELSFPVTVSVLPGTRHDAESAGWAKRHGF